MRDWTSQQKAKGRCWSGGERKGGQTGPLWPRMWQQGGGKAEGGLLHSPILVMVASGRKMGVEMSMHAWPSGVSEGHTRPQCVLCNCLGLASLPSLPTLLSKGTRNALIATGTRNCPVKKKPTTNTTRIVSASQRVTQVTSAFVASKAAFPLKKRSPSKKSNKPMPIREAITGIVPIRDNFNIAVSATSC